jgi:autotransporter passenger strand-loop-strand repeat protein
VSGTFIHFDPTLPQLTVDLSAYGLATGDVVAVTAVGAFVASVGNPPFDTDTWPPNFDTNYNNLGYVKPTFTVAYLLNNGTNLTIVNTDSPINDNADPNGDYGITVEKIASLYANGQTIDFNSLSTTQKLAAIALIQANDPNYTIYNASGSNLTVVLPSQSSSNEFLGFTGGLPSIFLNWDQTKTFQIGSSADTSATVDTVSGTDGNYNVAIVGAATTTIEINGNGSNTVTADAGADTIKINGNNNNTISTGAGTVTISVTGTGSSTVYGNITGAVSVSGGETLNVSGNLNGSASIGGNSILQLGGSASGILVNKTATLEIENGGISNNTVVHSGGLEIVSSGGTDLGASDGGNLQVYSGGMASGAEVTNGALLFVGLSGFGPGGVVSETTIDSGGFEFVHSGGTDFGASVDGTLQVFAGALASGAEINSSGLLLVGVPSFGAGGVVSGTLIDSSGFEFINSGGTDFGAHIIGTLRVLSHGTVSGADVSDAGLLLGAGGLVSSATIESGGLEIINSGGTDVGASVSGTLRVFSSGLASGVEVHSGGLLRVGALGFGAGGLVSGTTIDSGGLELVDSGGTDFSATISASAALVVFSRGTALDTTISGGTLVVSSGGSLGGKVTFAGSGGTLLIGGTAMPAAVISGFVSGDAIDLPNIPYDSKSGFAALVSGSNKQAVLKIVENKKTYSINLNVVQSPNNMKGQCFQLSSDSSGQGTEIQLMSGGTAGFDAGDYPGDKVMSALWKNTNLSWTLYYLYPAPSRSSRHAQWMGHRQALVNDGWQVVPIYVGQQDPLDPDPAQKNPSGARGVADAMSALAELGPVSSATPLGQGFAPGTTVYLDVEATDKYGTLGQNELNYISSWCSTVDSHGYHAGVYCAFNQALRIQAKVPVGTPFYVIHTGKMTVPNGGVVFPTPPPSNSDYLFTTVGNTK